MGFLRPEGKVHIAPLAKGSVAETHTVAALARCGYFPLLPAIAGGRYDLVFEDAEGNFWRVQVKTGRYKGGSVEFHTKSNSVKGSYRGQADYFAVYCPDLRKIYLVPVSEVTESLATLRVDELNDSRWNRMNKKRVRWAQDYEL